MTPTLYNSLNVFQCARVSSGYIIHRLRSGPLIQKTGATPNALPDEDVREEGDRVRDRRKGAKGEGVRGKEETRRSREGGGGREEKENKRRGRGEDDATRED